jgi:Ran GTPase-activating protein (RanGAP) involved in mRNA processing and transport
MQTLAILDLSGNQIGDNGVQQLGEALCTNKVKGKQSFWSIFFNYLYRHLLYWLFVTIESERKQRIISVKSYEQIRLKKRENLLDLFSVLLFLLVIDTDYTKSWRESNRRCRSARIGYGITNKQSERKRTFSICFFFHSLSQTLTTLELSKNQIGDRGIQTLAEVIRTNTVRERCFLLFIFYCSFLFVSDTYYTWSRKESDQRSRSAIS